MRTWVIRILPPAAFFVAFLMFIYWGKQNSPNRDDAKCRELEQIAASIPTFPNFNRTNTYTSSAADDAGIYNHYSSSASFSEVKHFYLMELSQRGWSLAKNETQYDWFRDYGGRILEFRKGEFLIAIEYAGDNSGSSSWDYAISFVWRDE